MPRVSDILPLLNAKTAAKFGTVSKTLSKVSRHRLANVKSRKTVTSHQAAKIGMARYKTTKKNQNLNKIYNSLNDVGILSQSNMFNRNVNGYIQLYGNLRNASITQKEQDRLKRKMIKLKSILLREIRRRRENAFYRNLNNMSQGTTPPTPENRYWR
jgi:hypothetical protein